MFEHLHKKLLLFKGTNVLLSVMQMSLEDWTFEAYAIVKAAKGRGVEIVSQQMVFPPGVPILYNSVTCPSQWAGAVQLSPLSPLPQPHQTHLVTLSNAFPISDDIRGLREGQQHVSCTILQPTSGMASGKEILMGKFSLLPHREHVIYPHLQQ